jgi:hypothetical protein
LAIIQLEDIVMPKLKSVAIDFKIPLFGGIKGTWVPNNPERAAAWELYVELVTRISIVELRSGEGILREALNSLYSIFSTTREILKKHGPEIAERKKEGEYSFGWLAIVILNYLLRPLLSEWHPRLADHESKRGGDLSVKEHEDKWEHNMELRKKLDETRGVLVYYSNCLAYVAEVAPLYNNGK